MAAVARPQLRTSFEGSEGYFGSPTGTVINGQNGWYQPVPDSADGLVMTYDDNVFSFRRHPDGGQQFLACASNNAKTLVVCRAEHLMNFDTNEWTLTYGNMIVTG